MLSDRHQESATKKVTNAYNVSEKMNDNNHNKILCKFQLAINSRYLLEMIT